MNKEYKVNRDPFWSENAKRSVEEIDKQFNGKVAEMIKNHKILLETKK